MASPRQPLFLARDSYRKRRLRDGARVLPIFGTVLAVLPLMWPAAPQMVLAHWIYVFVLWVALIVLAAVLAQGLGEGETAPVQDTATAFPPDSRSAFAPDNPSALTPDNTSAFALVATSRAGPPPETQPDAARTLQNRP